MQLHPICSCIFYFYYYIYSEPKNLIVKIEDSPYIKNCIIKISEPFGNFFIFENFVVSEIAEGVHYNWNKAKIIVTKVHEYFGSKNLELNYISNRINSYSVSAQEWESFYRENKVKINRYAIVVTSEIGEMNTVVEKHFFKNRLKKFNSLAKAIHWVQK